MLAEETYKSLVTMEFLEHVEFDLKTIVQIKQGTKVWATVPNWASSLTCGVFKDTAEVAARYAPFFLPFRVDGLVENQVGKTFFLIKCVYAVKFHTVFAFPMRRRARQ